MATTEIKDAVCTEITADGTQYFRSNHPSTPTHLQTIILKGIDRAPGVKVGDKGTMRYQKSGSRGFYQFTKD